MDEATSTLDTKTEERLMTSVRQLGITLLLIPHQLETIRDCHLIYLMDYGRLVQCDRHDELMSQQQGIYYELNKDYGSDV